MNQHLTYNPTTISPPVNMIQHVVPPPQYTPIQQDNIINTSASIPEPMKPLEGLHPRRLFTASLSKTDLSIGEEPQNIPIKYRSVHNRRMAYIQCSLIETALDWYTNLHI